MIHRLAALLLVAAGLSACATPSRGPEEGVPIVRAGLWLDPVPLPPDVRPGECLVRDFWAPGTYRWVRADCAPYVEAAPPVVYAEPLIIYEHHSTVSDWGQGHPDYGPAYGSRDLQAYGVDGAYAHFDTTIVPGDDGRYPVYRAAGRDAGGFLVWPGKHP